MNVSATRNTPETQKPSPTWPAIVAAIPIAAVIVVILEVAGIPWKAVNGIPKQIFGTLAAGFTAMWEHLWAPILFQLYIAGILCIGPVRKKAEIAIMGFAFVCCLAMSGYVYWTLIEYSKFSGYPPLVAAIVLLTIFLMLWVLLLRHRVFIGEATLRRRLITYGVLSVGVLGFLSTAILNLFFFPNTYPTVHSAAIVLVCVFVHLSLSWMWVTFPRTWINSKWFYRVGAVVLLHICLLSPIFVFSSYGMPSRTTFLRYTNLGGTSAVLSVRGNKDVAIRRYSTVPADPKGVEIFEKMSNMPKLPKDFRLNKYNVLLVSMEATRFRETSFANPKRNITPELLKFSKENTYIFERAYSAAPFTGQSLPSIFTMNFPHAAGLRLGEAPWDTILRGGTKTIVDLFKTSGYRTFWVGHAMYLAGKKQGFHFVDRVKHNKRNPLGDHLILKSAVTQIAKHKDGDKPFFGWLFFAGPHNPYLTHYKDMPKATSLDKYRQDLKYSDEQMGRLFVYLRKADLLRNTIILFHGDHGEEFKEHGGTNHANVYSESTHVPLLAYIPGAEGGIIDKPTSLTYIFPWLFLKGSPEQVTAAKSVLKKSVGPVMKATKGAVIVEKLAKDDMRSALVYQNHSIIYDFKSDYVELYDLRRDPHEKKNIFTTNKKAASVFKSRLDSYLQIREQGRLFEYLDPDDPDRLENKLKAQGIVIPKKKSRKKSSKKKKSKSKASPPPATPKQKSGVVKPAIKKKSDK